MTPLRDACWSSVARCADRARWWIARPLGSFVDRIDRCLLRLYWHARAKTQDDGIPF